MNNRKASFLGDANFPRSASKYAKGLKIELFQDLYVRYSKLALTFPLDRPVAIRGLENRLLNAFDTTGGGESMRRIAHSGGEPVPSWSWMAYDGAIDYVSAPGGQISWSHDIKSPFSAGSSDPSREHDMAALALEAPVWSLVNDLPN
ncbi:hypothetical protein NW755_010252 [Fusarium falciforme]|uniref:Uncharacterized protein n=1 Tax=Fusarium falciforme TaxID=195108 RepID=A0A9W8R1V6_9HYPO|nr:hypothetical protein NW755_010252 [Fusarium falciforme]